MTTINSLYTPKFQANKTKEYEVKPGQEKAFNFSDFAQQETAPLNGKVTDSMEEAKKRGGAWWTQPSEARKADTGKPEYVGNKTFYEGRQTKLAESFDNFLKLLLTQLKHQDPLSPMDTDKFTNQLAQFTQVEQSIYANKQIAELVNLMKRGNNNESLLYVDRKVKFATEELPFGGDPVEIDYEISHQGRKATILIQDEKGKLVASLNGGEEPGLHTILWDGRDQSGVMLPQGHYKIQIQELGENNKITQIQAYIRAIVDDIEQDESGVHLMVGSLVVDPQKVKQVYSRTKEFTCSAINTDEERSKNSLSTVPSDTFTNQAGANLTMLSPEEGSTAGTSSTTLPTSHSVKNSNAEKAA